MPNPRRAFAGSAWSGRPRLAVLFAVLFAACGADASSGANASSVADGTVQQTVPSAAAPSDACGWIPADEVAAVAGALREPPAPVRSVDDPAPRADGQACRYVLARQPAQGTGVVLVAVTLNDGPLLENVFGSDQRTGSTPMTASGPGWDFETLLPPNTFVGRQGHVGITVASGTLEVPREMLAELAGRVLSRMPDRPFALPSDPVLAELEATLGEALPAAVPEGPDPCALLEASEAEAVLGRLVVAPYRSSGDSPLADPAGESCAYFTSGHRALILRPTWSQGDVEFAMVGAVGATAGSVVPGTETVDLADGPWEAAVRSGATGSLHFLKGDRKLEVLYLTSSTDLDGAVRLARIAMDRL